MISIFRTSTENDWSYMGDLVKGVVFLGTPHRGSDWANRLYLLQLGTSIFWPRSKFVPLIRKGNFGLLATIAEQFNNNWGRRPILTIREGKGIGVLGKVILQPKCKNSLTCPQIVKPQDATTNCNGETCIDVPYDHRRIAKIKSKSEKGYNALITFIENLSQSQEPIPEIPEKLSADVGDPMPQIQTLSESQTETSSEEPHQSKLWARKHLQWFYHLVQRDIMNRSIGWEILEENFEDNIDSSAPVQERSKKFLSGTFSFCYPKHESTIIFLTVPGRKRDSEADWVIMSSDSLYHPGKHFGSIKIPHGFPFSKPIVTWESSLLSAYVNSVGHICLYDDFWHPGSTFYPILESLASIVIFGPALNIEPSTSLPELVPGLFSQIRNILVMQKNSTNGDWMIRVTNLFSRAYNRMDDEEDIKLSDNSGTADGPETSVPVSENDKDTSVSAIRDMEVHFTYEYIGEEFTQPGLVERSKYVENLRSQGLLDARKDFESVTTQKQLLTVERAWVDGINAALGNIAFHTQ